MAVRSYFWAAPALLVGAAAMLAGGVDSSRVSANVAYFLLGLLIVLGARSMRWRPGLPSAAVLSGLLLMTLPMPEIDGVRRWIDVGPLSLNASMLVAPWLLVVLAQLLDDDRVVAAVAVAVAVQVIHLLQPDAAQGAAFAAAAIVLLLINARRPSGLELAGTGALLALALATLAREDPLAPIAEVEGIVGLARDSALPLGVLAVLTCALLTVPFVRAATLSWRSHDRIVRAGQAALCAYVAVQVLAPIALNVPVPVMGYGATTVLAYATAFSASLLMPRACRTRSRHHA